MRVTYVVIREPTTNIDSYINPLLLTLSNNDQIGYIAQVFSFSIIFSFLTPLNLPQMFFYVHKFSSYLFTKEIGFIW
jgi:hypothetical protein